MWYVYMLVCDEKHFYVGTTDNLEKRLKEHREGHSYFTKGYKNIELAYQEWHPTKLSAEKREKQLNKLGGAEKNKLANKRENP
ncbi:MAG: hypothetical protein COT89_00480 [Candidatus Colwellbacteria bacterium CG10_big_fil_rev_8_21_14_0_10_42_22]|uniref:GIY-YIG domain-containing protein n=1 Tax=Candidatus Colwellbacteria bacterium CG10_big_fil_rev_8_21_14_0_10_42_22 TaxID=1974540 RepID=A0A2H0VGE1_9BACT|nr:MAG: hypothetical protein COT89_00480 [Candidatus Colwellbacteria bacterium CG10_big_fil_rev_8_21_14_0_10_42_22]